MGDPKSLMTTVFRTNGNSKNWCTGQCIHFTPPMLWACYLWNKERWGWSSHGMPYLLSLTSVISTSTAGMLMLTSTHLLSLYIGVFTFYLSRKLWEMSEWMQGVSCSPILEESPVWCWDSDRQFTMCGTSSVSLFWVHSSRVEVVHLSCLACTTVQRWVPSVGVIRKNISVDDSWTSGPLVFHEVGRDTFCNLAFHFVQFLLPLILHLSPPPVGISFRQNHVTLLQWNGISFPIIVPLPSHCLWCGLCLSLYKGFSQSFMQLSNVVVNMLVFQCTPYCWEMEVDG